MQVMWDEPSQSYFFHNQVPGLRSDGTRALSRYFNPDILVIP